MSEEKDSAQVAAELASLDEQRRRRRWPASARRARQGTGVPPQIQPVARPAASARPSPAARSGCSTCCTRCPQKAQDAIKKLMDEEHETDEQAAAAPGASRAAQGRGRRPARRPAPTTAPTPRSVRADGLMVSLSPVGGVRQAGRLFALFLDVFRLTFKRPFQFREFIQQAWFIASVTIVPTALVAIPFGAVIALQLGSLAAADRRPVVRRFGQRARDRARGQPDRLRAADRRRRWLGHLRRPRQPQDPRRDRRHGGARHLAGAAPGRPARARLHARRRSRSTAWSASSASSGGYFFNVILQGGTPGAYLASFSALAQLPDLYAGRDQGAASSASSPASSRPTRA